MFLHFLSRRVSWIQPRSQPAVISQELSPRQLITVNPNKILGRKIQSQAESCMKTFKTEHKGRSNSHKHYTGMGARQERLATSYTEYLLPSLADQQAYHVLRQWVNGNIIDANIYIFLLTAHNFLFVPDSEYLIHTQHFLQSPPRSL